MKPGDAAHPIVQRGVLAGVAGQEAGEDAFEDHFQLDKCTRAQDTGAKVLADTHGQTDAQLNDRRKEAVVDRRHAA